VFLLNKNIQQLLNSENLDVRFLRNILPNLAVLLSHNPETVNNNNNNNNGAQKAIED